MDLERWKRVRALSEALAACAREEWGQVLAASGEPGDIRAEAMGLLREEGDESPTIAAAPPLAALQSLREASSAGDPARRPGQRIGPWRLVSVLGEGGMGTVYLAERAEGGFTQRVALKCVRPGLQAEDLLARFRYERQILAGLEHPNIARLVDGGAGPDGEPYLALEYVEGEPLREYCDARRLDLPARLRLFLTVCEAVSYAHQRLVVHRDLKPSNILVDAAGQVKLLDFGIAKLLDADRASEATALGQRAFTPEYAAPEQILGEATSTSVDVYALGVLLFELLTGHRPHRVEGGSAAAVEQAVLNTEPSRPSSVVTRRSTPGEAGPEQLAQARATRPEQLRRLLRGDLDAIVLKALRREPSQRYASVRLLAEDLHAFLARRPVAARRGDRRYRALRFVQRHLLAVGLGVAAAASLLVGLGLALWQAREAGRERAVAQQERDAARRQALTAERTVEFLRSVFQLADPNENLGREVTALDLLDKGRRDIESQLIDEPEVRIGLVLALADAYFGLGQPAPARPLLESALEQARAIGDVKLQARVLLSLGAVITRQGNPGADEALTRAALDLSLPADEEGESLRAQLELRLAVRLADRSRYDAAEPLYRSGRERLQKVHARPVFDYVIPYSSLLNGTNRRAEAENLLREALAEARELLPRNHPTLAALTGQLGTNLSRQGRLDEAEALMREALGIKLAILGEEHPSTSTTAHNLGQVLSDQGRWDEAEAVLRKVLDHALATHGSGHHRTAATQAALARALLGQDRAAESEPLWREAYAVVERNMGRGDTAAAITALGLGRALLAQGRLDEASDWLARAEASYTEGMPHTTGGLARVQLERLRVAMARGDVPECAPAEAARERFAQLKLALGEGYALAVRVECGRRRGEDETRLQALLDQAHALLSGSSQVEATPEARYARTLRP